MYTVADQLKVVEYARFRGVRVILETDLPGHSTSWSLALPDIFISCGRGGHADYNGMTRVIDPTLNATWKFLDEFLGEFGARFPDKYIHLGGDEVSVSCFNNSASVRQWMADRGTTSLQDVYVYFETRIHELAAKHGKNVQTWHDAFVAAHAVSKAFPEGAVAQVWMSSAQVNNASSGMGSLVKQGASVVRSSGYYFSQGFSTGGSPVTWEPILNSDPIPPNLTKEEQERVLGGEVCMWGEVTDDVFIDQKIWFRASAFAERYWSSNATISSYCGPDGCSYMTPSIQARLVKHRCRLVQRGIQAQAYATEIVPDRSRWMQCELFLPPRLDQDAIARSGTEEATAIVPEGDIKMWAGNGCEKFPGFGSALDQLDLRFDEVLLS